MRGSAIALFAVAFLPTMPAHAQQPAATIATGDVLRSFCEAGEGDWRRAFCTGYVAAVADIAQSSKQLCEPQGMTLARLQEVALDGLLDHPAERSEPADFLVTKYLTAAFPCAAEKRKSGQGPHHERTRANRARTEPSGAL